MKSEDLIPADDICRHYHVEHRFIHALHDNGIIEMERIEKKEYISIEKISRFERMRRLYYELDINLEGLEAIQNLLEKVDRLQKEKRRLENRLRLYE